MSFNGPETNGTFQGNSSIWYSLVAVFFGKNPSVHDAGNEKPASKSGLQNQYNSLNYNQNNGENPMKSS
jgi:hypothetical protein